MLRARIGTSEQPRCDDSGGQERSAEIRNLHGYVAQLGSLSQAARHFGCSQPAVSGTIAELEHALGVKLLDRSTKGVQLNIYGRTLLRRCAAAFDELVQGINDIENLAGSAHGDLRIGCTEAVASAILQPVIEEFSQKYPDVALRLHYADSLMPQLCQLRDRNIDICLARWRKLPVADEAIERRARPLLRVRLRNCSRWARYLRAHDRNWRRGNRTALAAKGLQGCAQRWSDWARKRAASR